jgi:putative SOS response-associated peptidase YedK
MCNFIWTERKMQEAAARRLNFTFDFGEEFFGDKNPTDPICIALATGFEVVRWSLIPNWSKEIPKVLMTQARAETVNEKPSFRGLMDSNRCVIPVSGFYEWYAKQKYGISREDGEPMYLAGLWDEWQGQKSATIITTEPSEFVRQYQDRMPLVLESADIETWLCGSEAEAQTLITERSPLLVAHTVSGQGNLFD